jgi:hypothetical protein
MPRWWRPPPDAFTVALEKIIRESRKRFVETKGARIEMNPGPRVWFEARTFLPGAEYCQVQRGREFYRREWTAAVRLRALHAVIAPAKAVPLRSQAVLQNAGRPL